MFKRDGKWKTFLYYIRVYIHLAELPVCNNYYFVNCLYKKRECDGLTPTHWGAVGNIDVATALAITEQ